MSMMKLVIDIPKYLYDAIMDNTFGIFSNAPCNVIRNGTPYVEGCIEEHKPLEKWECVEDDNYAGGGYWECPSCKDRFSFRGFNMLNHMPYCPKCGDRVKTELEVENEDSN